MSQTEFAKACPSIVERVIPYIAENFAEEIDLDALANEAGMSRFGFCRKFQRECAVSPMKWLWTFRALLAAEFIKLDPSWSLTDVAFACGFTSSAHFSRFFKTTLGTSPSKFRKRARIEELESMSRSLGSKLDLMYSGQSTLVSRMARQALPGTLKSIGNE